MSFYIRSLSPKALKDIKLTLNGGRRRSRGTYLFYHIFQIVIKINLNGLERMYRHLSPRHHQFSLLERSMRLDHAVDPESKPVKRISYIRNQNNQPVIA